MELKTENLVKCYGKKAAVRNVSLTLSEGIYGLLGENVPRYKQKTLPIT